VSRDFSGEDPPRLPPDDLVASPGDYADDAEDEFVSGGRAGQRAKDKTKPCVERCVYRSINYISFAPLFQSFCDCLIATHHTETMGGLPHAARRRAWWRCTPRGARRSARGGARGSPERRRFSRR
jgi:hypothetical protein